MSHPNTLKWKRWYQKNCQQWNDSDKRRYLNVPNDPEEIDDIELESCRELIVEINGKEPIE